MLINGEYSSLLPVSDRGLAYGDGVFETIRFHSGNLLFETRHMKRLQRGCSSLGIDVDMSLLVAEIRLALQDSPVVEGILKIIVTRGSGGRGYRSQKQPATRILTLHPLPDYSRYHPESGIRAFVCNQRLSEQTVLAGIKHLNRLEQVMASREWPDDSYLEGLMLDQQGNVVEGTRSNLFMAQGGRLYTPDLDRSGINGIMREVLLDRLAGQVEIANISLARLQTADEVFVCNSVFGIWPLTRLDAQDNSSTWTPGPFAEQATRIFNEALQQ